MIKRSVNYFCECKSVFVTNIYSDGPQVIVSAAEMKDWSSGPVDFEGIDSEDGTFSKDPVEPERILTEEKQQVSIIEVS